jgi:type IV secretion system protein TrbL
VRCETVRRYATPLLPVLLLNAIALPATAGILTDIADQYQTASAGWMTAALHYANHLFFLLVSIEIAVTAIYHMLSREEFVAFLIALFIKLLGIGFFYVLLVEAPAWIPTIIQSFTQAGAGIGGTPVLDPSGVLSQGIDVGKTVLQGINFPDVFDHLLTVLVAGLAAIIVVFAYAIVAAQLLVALVESYIVIGGGVLMLGFAGTRWTLVFTERYLGYLVSVGIKLFVLYLIIGYFPTKVPNAT